MASKKINKAPSGTSFMYVPAGEAGPMVCPPELCGCGKGHVIMYAGGFPTCNEHSKFRCSKKCGWKRIGEFQHEPTQPTPHVVITDVVKTQKQPTRKAAHVKAFRAEVGRRMEILAEERAKFPAPCKTRSLDGTRTFDGFCSLLKKRFRNKRTGKVRTAWVPVEDFTDEMREHMHRFAVDQEAIWTAIKNGDPLPEYPAPVV